MKRSISRKSFVVCVAIVAGCLLAHRCLAETPRQTAEQMIQESGVKGGLIVHAGCGGGMTAELHHGDSYLVHALGRTLAEVEKTRKNLSERDLRGPISVDLWSGGRLPYVDNSVNLLVVEEKNGVSRDEILRVLVPRGAAMIAPEAAGSLKGVGQSVSIGGRNWIKLVKPQPDNIDEWTHYMHDPSNNAVAHDTVVGPPRHLQWDAAPRYSRHHEFTSSVAAMVSANGRLFSIIDMGSRASIHMPPKWTLTARDAFNGIVLWERKIDGWFNHLWPLKDGPAQPPRRLVAAGESVYVTLGLEAPVSRLDAATGKVLQTYAGTEYTEEILFSDGKLYLLKNHESMDPASYYPKLMVCWDEKKRTIEKSEGFLLTPEERKIVVVDAESGKIMWHADTPVEPLTLALDERSVYFHNWKSVVCVDRKTGERRWVSEPVAERESMGYVYGPTLVSYMDVVLFADGRNERKINALSKKDGSLLWQAQHYAAGHAGSAEDLLVIDDLVWCGKIAGGRHDGVFTGRDTETGKVMREFLPDVETYWFHHRCYRAKATDKFFLSSRTRIEFIDVREQTWQTNHWVRGACTYGILPCNGLVYAPPHPCACYLESKLSGLNALASASQRDYGEPLPAADRLEQGPTWSDDPLPTSDPADSWPTYRHDMARSGSTPVKVKTPISTRWQVELPGELTAPIAAEGQVFLASQTTNDVFALDTETGAVQWSYTAGGRVDSPPTFYRGLVLFGSADGRVYCLRASDGALVWRFAAAPHDMRLVSYGRLESVWPVHGNVLVRDGIVYCVAGRSTMLDGGLHFYRLDAATGQVISERVFHDQKNPQEGVKNLNMPVASTDILSSDGEMVFMLSQAFDLEGNRLTTVDPKSDPVGRASMQLGEDTHLFSPTGYLDDDAWHRSYWIFGRTYSSGCNYWFRAGRFAPAGRMLVFDDDSVYGFGRDPALFVWSHVLENRIFASARQASPEAIENVAEWAKKAGRNAVFNRQFMRETPVGERLAPNQRWSVERPPLHVRAMVLADGILFAAGPPDVLDEDEAFQRPFDADITARKAAQDAAYLNQRGAKLMAFSAGEGDKLLEMELDAPPVWDGMAAAGGKLFLTTKDNKVLCLGE